MVLLGRYVSSSPSSSMMCCVLRVLLRHISNKVWPKGQSTSALQEMSASWAAFWISFFASNNAQQQQKILTFLISFWWGVKLLNGQKTRIAQCQKFPKKSLNSTSLFSNFTTSLCPFWQANEVPPFMSLAFKSMVFCYRIDSKLIWQHHLVHFCKQT